MDPNNKVSASDVYEVYDYMSGIDTQIRKDQQLKDWEAMRSSQNPLAIGVPWAEEKPNSYSWFGYHTSGDDALNRMVEQVATYFRDLK